MIASGPPPHPPECELGARMLGLALRARRIESGLTLRRCAEAMGMSMTDLSAVEQGARVFTPDEFDRFNKVLEEAK